jgi:hypothetical protein
MVCFPLRSYNCAERPPNHPGHGLNHETPIVPSPIESGDFHRGLDDVIIVPLVLAALAINKLVRFLILILVRLLDFAFPLAMQLVWLPLLAARMIGDGMVAAFRGILRILPLGDTRRRQWTETMRQNWEWLRERISYRAFEHAVHVVFESGMAWVFGKCRRLTPSKALLVIIGAILWLPISFGAATALHIILAAKVATWPAWMQLLHPLGTVIAKSKLLVLPVYPAAWPQAKKHPFVQFIAGGYLAMKNLYLVRKIEFRYRHTERAAAAAVDRFEHATGLSRAALWFRATEQSVEDEPIVHKPSQRLRLFYQRWSIKFSAEYYEAKEREVERETEREAAASPQVAP